MLLSNSVTRCRSALGATLTEISFPASSRWDLQRKFFELLIQLSFSVAQLKIAKRFWIEALYFKKDVPPVSPSSRPKNTVQPQPECLVGFHVAPIFMPPHAST